jgi:AcrR family transcriptional regulator
MHSVSARIHHAAMRLFADKGGRTLAVSELASEAGLSRGTIYNNIDDPSRLFTAVCQMMSEELTATVLDSFEGVDDPAHRLANIIRLCVRRVHDEPHWGRFLARFAMLEPKLGAFWGGIPAEEVRNGLALGRFVLKREQIASFTAAAGGATFGAIALVLHGHRTWRQAGSDTAELMLRSLGIARAEAHALANLDLGPLRRHAGALGRAPAGAAADSIPNPGGSQWQKPPTSTTPSARRARRARPTARSTR